MPTVTTNAYGTTTLDALTEALFTAVSEQTGCSVEEVADTLLGLHGIPSDGFMSSYDDEVSALVRRFAVQ